VRIGLQGVHRDATHTHLSRFRSWLDYNAHTFSHRQLPAYRVSHPDPWRLAIHGDVGRAAEKILNRPTSMSGSEIFGIFLLPLPCGWHPIYSFQPTSVAFCFRIQPLEGHTMETLWNKIDLMAKEIKDTLTDFMLNHSKIEPPRYEEVAFFSPEGDRSYDFLEEAGRKVQSSLSKSYERYYSTLQPLLKDQSDEVLSKMTKLNEVIVRTIEHRITWCENTQKALDLALAALEDQLKLVKTIFEEKSREN
jgi:hypothetical protein